MKIMYSIKPQGQGIPKKKGLGVGETQV
jgi:hypothetical protein